MRFIIRELRPGMVLAEDVVDGKGSMLLADGTTLTKESIEELEGHAIRAVTIHDPSKDSRDSCEKLSGTESDTGETSARVPTGPEKKPESAPPPKGPVVPTITVHIAEDRLTAGIRIAPAGDPPDEITPDHIKAALANEGVTHGIREDALLKAVEKWNETRTVFDVAQIAHGNAPRPGKKGTLQFKVQKIDKGDVLQKALAARYWWELKDCGVRIQRVDPGTQIAQIGKGLPPTEGTDVCGQKFVPREEKEEDITYDKSVQFDEAGGRVLSHSTGIAYFVNGVVGVVEVSFDGTAEVEVSSDNMSATVVMRPPMEGGRAPDEQAVRELLTKNNVIYGIDENALRSLFTKEKEERPGQKDETLVVAKGTPAVDGDDGRTEFLVNISDSLRPKMNPDGSVDFRDVSFIHPVVAGTELARLVPPCKGTPGKNVLGQQLPAKPGTPSQLPMGSNTGLSTSDRDLLIAKVDGNVRFNGKMLEVSEGFVVDGDVNFSTGNIKYDKSVLIRSDVKAGFKVECGGDVEIGGTIEDAEVIAKGGVLCKQGFVGHGKGLIDAGGDVSLTFTKNQHIRSRANVVIAHEAMDAWIEARGTIIVSGDPISVVGGRLCAKDAVVVRAAGNASGVETRIEVGRDYTMQEELTEVDARLEKTSNNIRNLVATLKHTEELVKRGKKFSEEEKSQFGKMKRMLEKLAKEAKAGEARKKEVLAAMYVTDKAVITIERAAHPGTVFKIGELQMHVHEEIIGPKKVRLIERDIRII